MDHEINCPQCGEQTERLHEGYCEECCKGNQLRIDMHIAQYDRWRKLSDAERGSEIKRASREY